jgi:Maltose operon periplasmic protein precursor (MalM)
MHARKAVSLCAGFIWVACTIPAGPANAAKAVKAHECLADPAGLTVVSLAAYVKEKKGKFVLGEKSECLVTADGGNLPVVVVELPQFSEPYCVSVRSVVGASVLVPRIEVLDSQKTVRRSLGLADIHRRGDSLEVDLFVNEPDAADRYLVIHADAAAFGQGESRSTMGIQTTYVGTGYWTSGTEASRQINYVDKGTLFVELKGPQWEKKK